MNKGLSIWLDVIRVAATLIVVISHWAYPRFTEGRYGVVRDWNLGSDAVIIFFVISGCVIAYAAGRDKSPLLFAFNRLTRLWTVLIPALVLTWVFDNVGVRIDETAYPTGFYVPHPVGEFFSRGISFSNQWTSLGRLRLGTNGPLWSLSYEAAYYSLFGIAIFTSGVLRLILLATAALIFGVNALLLMPAWLMGVVLWNRVKDGHAEQMSKKTAIVAAIGAPLAYVACHILHVPEILLAITANALGVADARSVVGFSDEAIWNAIIGLLTMIHVLGMARLLKTDFAGAKIIRWCAGASFSIYVTHYPALHLLDAILGDIAGRDALLLVGAIVVGFAFASVFERPIRWFRHALWPRQSASSPG
ncbi:acyltransferase [Rhodobacteraceae bacterium]|nr:acyltransferase [Paracoccaceae bacterium]